MTANKRQVEVAFPARLAVTALALTTAFLLIACNGHEQATVSANPEPATSSVALLVESLSDGDANGLVFLNDVHLQQSKSGSALYAVGKNGHRVLLINVPRTMLEISEESVYDVFGSIQKAPSIASAKRLFKLDKDEAANLSKERFYIDASSIVKVKKADD